jgi:hypothetical protein
MVDQHWRRRIDRLVSNYHRGVCTAREVQSAAVEAIPIEGVAELITRLPTEIVKRLREFAVETEWSEDWPPLLSINAPQLTQESQRLLRLKWAALRALFESEETSDQ